MRRIDFITVHTAGAASKGRAVHQTGKEIDAYHRGKGWKCIGYHAYIEQNGRISEFARPVEEYAAAVEGWNGGILAVCCSGHGDLESFTTDQHDALVGLCVDWCRAYGLPATRVIGHHEADEHGAPTVYKSCPGALVNMSAIRDQVQRLLLPVDVRDLDPVLELRERVARIEAHLGLTGVV